MSRHEGSSSWGYGCSGQLGDIKTTLLKKKKRKEKTSVLVQTPTSKDSWAVAWVCVWNEDLASAHLGFKGRRIFFLVSKHPAWGSFVRHLLSHVLLKTDPKYSHKLSTSGTHTGWLLWEFVPSP